MSIVNKIGLYRLLQAICCVPVCHLRCHSNGVMHFRRCSSDIWRTPERGSSWWSFERFQFEKSLPNSLSSMASSIIGTLRSAPGFSASSASIESPEAQSPLSQSYQRSISSMSTSLVEVHCLSKNSSAGKFANLNSAESCPPPKGQESH